MMIVVFIVGLYTQMGLTERDLDDVKNMFGSMSLYVLGLTYIVSRTITTPIQMMNYVLKLMNYVLKLMIVVLKMTEFALKMMNFRSLCSTCSSISLPSRMTSVSSKHARISLG